MRIEPPCSSGNEIFQSLAIAEVRNQGDGQDSPQLGGSPRNGKNCTLRLGSLLAEG